MTSYSHTLTVSDSEYGSLRQALFLMIEHCEVKLAEQAEGTFWADKHHCESILRKLDSSIATLMSTNNFNG